MRLADFDVALVPRGNAASMRAFIESVTATRNREAMLRGSPRGGAFAFAIQSAQDDDVMSAAFRTLEQAARRQLTGTRAGLLVAGFDSISSEQLRAVAAQDQDPNQPETALNNRIRSFFSNGSRNHVVNAAFLSRGALVPVAANELDSGGTVYNFPNRTSSFWNDDFAGLFNPQ